MNFYRSSQGLGFCMGRNSENIPGYFNLSFRVILQVQELVSAGSDITVLLSAGKNIRGF